MPKTLAYTPEELASLIKLGRQISGPQEPEKMSAERIIPQVSNAPPVPTDFDRRLAEFAEEKARSDDRMRELQRKLSELKRRAPVTAPPERHRVIVRPAPQKPRAPIERPANVARAPMPRAVLAARTRQFAGRQTANAAVPPRQSYRSNGYGRGMPRIGAGTILGLSPWLWALVVLWLVILAGMWMQK